MSSKKKNSNSNNNNEPPSNRKIKNVPKVLTKSTNGYTYSVISINLNTNQYVPVNPDGELDRLWLDYIEEAMESTFITQGDNGENFYEMVWGKKSLVPLVEKDAFEVERGGKVKRAHAHGTFIIKSYVPTYSSKKLQKRLKDFLNEYWPIDENDNSKSWTVFCQDRSKEVNKNQNYVNKIPRSKKILEMYDKDPDGVEELTVVNDALDDFPRLEAELSKAEKLVAKPVA